MMRFTVPLFLALAAVQSDAFTPAKLATPVSTPTSLHMANPTQSVFLTPETAKACIEVAGGSPVYAYSMEKLEESADACLAFPNAYGLTVRYAMKACPNRSILKFFHSKGIHIDASSGYEVRRAMTAGIPPENISLSTQELPSDFAQLIDMGVKINAW
jgi:diaminopimelate decarboxylase